MSSGANSPVLFSVLSIDRPVAPLAPLVVLRHGVRAGGTLTRYTRIALRRGRGAPRPGRWCRRSSAASRRLARRPGHSNVAVRAVLGSSLEALPAQRAADGRHASRLSTSRADCEPVSYPPGLLTPAHCKNEELGPDRVRRMRAVRRHTLEFACWRRAIAATSHREANHAEQIAKCGRATRAP
jgi:hypothetical protein